MSLTSYRAAPPRVTVRRPVGGGRLPAAAWGPLRWSVSCPAGSWSSEWVSRVDLGGPGGDRLSRALRHSTMGAEAFDGRVRDGIGSGGFAWATRPAKIDAPPSARGTGLGGVGGGVSGSGSRGVGGPPGGRVGHGVMRAIKPNERLVPVSCTHRCASTPGLSTWWSSTALQGELVSRWVSSLDAFSSYPVRT